MTHGSLFSGIGGFDLASSWMGWENKFHCEWNEFGQKILKYYWPNAISYGDITKTDFTIHRGQIDIITGGFPCQPYSMAGKRKGKADERHLWPEMLRSIREIQPSWIVGENVSGIINWSGGLVFHEVQTDLEAEGYEVFPVVLPACAVNAPHRRDRIWFVAKNTRCNGRCNCEHEVNSGERGVNVLNDIKQNVTTDPGLFRQEISEKQATRIEQCNKGKITPDTDGWRNKRSGNKLGKSGKLRQRVRDIEVVCHSNAKTRTSWDFFPTQSLLCGRDDGLSSRLSGITFPKFRNESIKAYGNAIVPQVAYQIFKTINDFILNT